MVVSNYKGTLLDSMHSPQYTAGVQTSECRRARAARKLKMEASNFRKRGYIAKVARYVPVAKKKNRCRACGMALRSAGHSKRCTTHCYSCHGPKESAYTKECNACNGQSLVCSAAL